MPQQAAQMQTPQAIDLLASAKYLNSQHLSSMAAKKRKQQLATRD